MNKILVSGGAGYIGSHTVLALLKSGYQVIVLDNFSNSSPESLRRVAKLASREPVVIQGDLTDNRTLHQIFSKNDEVPRPNFKSSKYSNLVNSENPTLFDL